MKQWKSMFLHLVVFIFATGGDRNLAAGSLAGVSGNRNRVLPSTAHAIHETPCIELSRILQAEGIDGRLLAKLEYMSPGFSKKDRIALQMIEEAKADGSLSPNQTVVELTSGNTGTGLAIVCAALGHPFVAVMSAGNSMERARMMRALGAEVILVDQCPGSTLGQVSGDDLARVFKVTKEVCRERSAFRADQFQLEGNVRAHELHTGPEILAQAANSGIMIDGFVDFVGSGGTFGGITSALRAAYGKGYTGGGCFLVEPTGAAVLAGEVAQGVGEPHKIQGGGYGMRDLVPLRMHLQPPDGYLKVSSEEAVDTCRKLARLEGVFSGFSGGANVHAAMQLLRGPLKGKTVACVICDSGLKYLSTDLWEEI